MQINQIRQIKNGRNQSSPRKEGISMARSRKPVNPAAENALDRMKFEIASELGVAERVRSSGWATMTSADCGRVGGQMVRKMIEQYESNNLQ
jgi:hypothetical protein